MSIRGLAAAFFLVLAACAPGDERAESVGHAERAASVDGCGGGPTIENGGFETGTLQGWGRHGRAAVVPKHHSGTRGVRLARATASAGQHWVQQAVEVPAAADGGSSLSLWMQPHCAGAPDYRRVEVREVGGPRLATLLKDCTSSALWEQRTFDLAPWAGQDVVLRVVAYDDGVVETPSYLFVDDVQVLTEVAPPAVLITEPADGDNVGGRVTVTAAPRISACTALDRVDFLADGVLFATSTASPATVEWPAGGAPAAHTLTARVFDEVGGTAEHSIGVTWPCGSSPVWTANTPLAVTTPPVTAALGPNGFDLEGIPQSAVFVPTSSSVAARDAGSGAALGSLTTAAAISRPPLVVEVGAGAGAVTYVFIASSDGHLYRQQMVGGVMVPAGSRDLRRPGCVSDALTATPALQKKALSNPGYTLPGDAIFVITHHGCGDTNENQILAFDPAAPMNAPPLWTFNEFGEYQIDHSIGGCIVDLSLNRLYCATNVPVASSQYGLWAIDVNTGAAVWRADVGSVHSRPVLDPVSRHLFVASRPGVIHAVDPDGAANGIGKVDWSLQLDVAAGASLESDIWAEHRGVMANKVFAVDTYGVLHAVADDGTSGAEMWDLEALPGEQFTSQPVAVVQGPDGFLYLGTSNGRMMQVEYDTIAGRLDAVRTISDIGTSTAGALLLPNALVATSQDAPGGTVTMRFCLPFTGGAPF